MNYDECLTATIEDSVKDALQRLPELEPYERTALILEWGEYIFNPLELEETLMVPTFEEKEETK